MGCGNSTLRSTITEEKPKRHVGDHLAPPFHGEDFCHHWRLVHKLGEGSFAQVHAVKCKTSSRCAALKIQKTASDSKDVVREARVWEKIGRHENILHLLGSVVIDGTIGLLMEKCEKSLSEHLLDMKIVSDYTMTHMFFEMTSAIAHLESVQIVHRDVKPDNFLCKADNHTLKLCDFGFSKLMPKSGQLFGTFGTPHFMSPEMVGDGPHDLKTDVWSLGATFYLLLYSECPYTDRPATSKRVMRVIAAGFPEPRYHGRDDIRRETKEALVAMLRRSMSTRISASEALEWPFLDFSLVGVSEESTCDPGLFDSNSTCTCDSACNRGVFGSPDLAIRCYSL